ncbi:MAG TPA: GNAT family N-acetyltransferase [Candidatus Limnocylindria bacterium]|nr:GNAT family N-acetyltransferase [Candidatus Limnocylindria bacterium]
MKIVASGDVDPERLHEHLLSVWHADFVVAHDEPMRPADLPGFVALDDDVIVGHAAYRISDDGCELVAIAAEPPRKGTGSALLERVVGEARAAGCERVWLTTTNDNVDALRFYQRRGFRLVTLRVGSVVEARKRWKPDLPATGSYGIPMRDELDLELSLGS